MKLNLAILAVTMTFSSNFANIDIGIKGGLSLYKARLTYGPENQFMNSDYGFRIGPSIMIFGEISQNKNLFHNVQLNYYQAGGKGSIDIMSFNGEMINQITGKGWDDIAINYVGLGYNFIYKLPLSTVTPYASIGFSADYLININHRIKYDGPIIDLKSFDNVKLNRINVRPLISTGLECKLSRIRLLLDYTFSYNLLPFYQHSVDATNGGAKHTTSGHLINIGCKFNIK